MKLETVYPFTLLVSSLWKRKVFSDCEQMQPTHVISMLNPGTKPPSIKNFISHAHHVQYLFDETAPNYRFERTSELNKLKMFIDEVFERKNEFSVRMLVHCHLGVSRSTAVAYYILAKYHGIGNETKAFSQLLRITNKPWPNRGLVSHFDVTENFEGRMVDELDLYRKRFPNRHAAYRRFNKLHGRV